MPANLTAQYHKAEQAYRQAQTSEEELACLQEMLKEIPKHKGTDKLQADLKQKISRLKADLTSQKKAGAPKSTSRIPRQGAGRAVIIGAPNSGKSSLLSVLTRAKPEVAEYPFTTREPAPGMMAWEDATVQLIDTPPITADFYEPIVQNLIRGADLVLLVLDLGSDDGGEELHTVVQRVNNTKTRLAKETFVDEDDIGVTYTKTFLILNKCDLPEAEDRLAFFDEFLILEYPRYRISCQSMDGIEALRDAIYRAMDAVRVYTKLPNQKSPDMEKPFTLRRGSTLLDLAELIHKDVAKNLKGAKVWGTAVHDGTLVKGDYQLHDRDIVELHA